VDDEPTPAFCRGVELEDGSEDAAASRLCQSVWPRPGWRRVAGW